MGGYIAIGVLVVLILILVVSSIHVVQQSKAFVVERLGSFSAVWGNGLHWKWPFIERVVKKVSLKEQVADFDPQPVITKDNVTMQIDTVIYFQITDPKLYTYGVEYPMSAIENLTATTLRNIIGEMELDQSLTSRDVINAKMRSILDEATDPWGIKVNRVEPILQAEGQKASQILVAEGEQQSAILRADAAKQAKIMAAEAEAQSILKVQQAMADSMRLLNENAPNDQVIKLKALEAMQKMAAKFRGWPVWPPAPRRCWRATRLSKLWQRRKTDVSSRFWRRAVCWAAARSGWIPRPACSTCSIITATPPVLPCWWMPRASRCSTAALPTHRSFDPQGAGHRPAPYVVSLMGCFALPSARHFCPQRQLPVAVPKISQRHLPSLCHPFSDHLRAR